MLGKSGGFLSKKRMEGGVPSTKPDKVGVLEVEWWNILYHVSSIGISCEISTMAVERW